jgi:hypothetical protein
MAYLFYHLFPSISHPFSFQLQLNFQLVKQLLREWLEKKEQQL